MEKDEADEIVYSDNLNTWHPSLTDPPPGYLDSTTFTLGLDEAEFLKERIQETCRGTLMEYLVVNKVNGLDRTQNVWEIGIALPAAISAQIHHAERFSLLMYGASILYNAYVSMLMGEDYDYQGILEKLEGWFNEYLGTVKISGDWRPDELYEIGIRADLSTMRFVNKWHEIASRLSDWKELLQPEH
jgi:hypothetical protein